eukprot:3387025-Rhodomonas_salina.5
MMIVVVIFGCGGFAQQVFPALQSTVFHSRVRNSCFLSSCCVVLPGAEIGYGATRLVPVDCRRDTLSPYAIAMRCPVLTSAYGATRVATTSGVFPFSIIRTVSPC